MSQATEILTELQRRGVIVAVEEATLSLKPKSALDDSLLARVREAKPANHTSPAEPAGYVFPGLLRDRAAYLDSPAMDRLHHD